MKLTQTALLGAAMALSLPLALPAMASGQSDHSAYQQKMTQMSNHMQWQGQHTIQGQVQSVDHDKGIVKLSSQDNAQLKLHFPTSALQNVKEGDQVTVKLAYATGHSQMSGHSSTSTGMQGGSSMAGGSSTSGQMAGGSMSGSTSTNSQAGMNSGMSQAGNWDGAHTMQATVESVDQSDGTVKLESNGEQLVLQFPQSALQPLRQGEQIKVRLALQDTSSSSSSISR
ncbi:MAG TPA: hypothetical protein VFH57_08115 [Gammaproteobacteria bacterium]|nr:hypothetical protein [Gammaproteobacteria bacterium]